MIKQLQKRFIRIAVVALTVAMVLVVGVVNLVNWISVRGELSDTLNLLVSPELPEEASTTQAAEKPVSPELPEEVSAAQTAEKTVDQALPPLQEKAGGPFRGRLLHFRNMVAESNWFSAVVTDEGEILRLFLDQTENLEEDTAREMVQQAVASGHTEGFLQDHLYRIRSLRTGRAKVIMLNCETRLAAVRNLMLFSAVACAGGILLAWLLVRLASRKAVEPTIRNMEQQKEFITNASHELKTPLTVISTNMELLQMEIEDNQWVRSTRKQTAAMRKLVDELVYLSRMEEESSRLEMETLDPGKLLEETAEPFEAVAEFNGRKMSVNAAEGIRMAGDRASLQRLISTLCDNAVKYAAEGEIIAEVRSEGKNHVLLRVSNPVAEPLTREQCSQLFNRFYRKDPSRNKDKKDGFGIGLAIAAAIVEKHGGRISAAMEGDRLVFTCLLPKEAK